MEGSGKRAMQNGKR